MTFEHIKEKDKNNLGILIKALESKELKAGIRGSASRYSEYHDIDLNVWDSRKDYRDNPKLIDETLKNVKATQISFSNNFLATWVQGRWRFKINESEFDLIYTAWGPSFVGYKK